MKNSRTCLYAERIILWRGRIKWCRRGSYGKYEVLKRWEALECKWGRERRGRKLREQENRCELVSWADAEVQFTEKCPEGFRAWLVSFWGWELWPYLHGRWFFLPCPEKVDGWITAGLGLSRQVHWRERKASSAGSLQRKARRSGNRI